MSDPYLTVSILIVRHYNDLVNGNSSAALSKVYIPSTSSPRPSITEIALLVINASGKSARLIFLPTFITLAFLKSPKALQTV